MNKSKKIVSNIMGKDVEVENISNIAYFEPKKLKKKMCDRKNV